MKIKDGYLLREVAGNHVVVPTGKAALDFSGMITLNDAGTFLWKLMDTDRTEQELLSALLDEYEVGEATAKVDLSEFLAKLRSADLYD